MFPKSSSNFHAARIDGWFFGTSGLLTFTRDNFRIHSLWENSPFGTGERFRALFRSSDFFVIKYFWNRVVTYLWERDVQTPPPRWGGGSGKQGMGREAAQNKEWGWAGSGKGCRGGRELRRPAAAKKCVLGVEK